MNNPLNIFLKNKFLFKFLTGFTLGLFLSVGLFFLFLNLKLTPEVLAATGTGNVNVSGCLLLPAPSCGDWDASQCIPGGTGKKIRTCTDACTTWTEEGNCGGPPPPPPPPPRVPTPLTCRPWSECLACVMTRFFTDGCPPPENPETQACGVGCGNGTVEPGEQCDDGNVNNGDCCSGTCQQEIIISNVGEQVTNTTAEISWSTLCQASTAILEWGTTPSVSDGSVSNLSGTNYSYNISDLTPNTIYYYRITANADGLQTTYSDTFLTLGGTENCNNQIDDDHDGFCDYPASVCTDGTVAGDPECACTPDFSCTPGACGADNQWTVTCVDQTTPQCQPDYQYQQECNICPGVIPGVCQEVNPDTCQLINLSNCCGNNSCEPPGEDPYNCAIDCLVDCLSEWECNEWQPAECPPSGFQTRDCFDQNACEIPIDPPANQQSCDSRCPGLTCGVGEAINIDQCVCHQIVPFCGNGICEAGETYAQCPADCILPCTPNWTCLNWGECQNDLQRRECYDLNNCDLDLDRPPEIRSCRPGCEVACQGCQTINLDACQCEPVTPCCGNNSCETQENVWSCRADCGVPPDFRLTLPVCLDGLDNDRDGFVDYPADPGCKKPSDRSELDLAEILANLKKILDNKAVQETNKIAAPILAITIAINTFATFSFLNFLTYLQYFFTQPFAVIFRRKRKKWGIVYNSLTKQPVDLAIVRLYQKENNRLIQSRVTDKLGRFSFLVTPGRYYLTETKPKFVFPSVYLKDKKEDVKYLDLYHGEVIEVTQDNANITVNIPVDPEVEAPAPAKVIFQYYLRKVQYAAAFLAVPLAGVSLAINPGPLTLTLFGFHCLLFDLFHRLGYQRPPKSWGVVYDNQNKKPINLAITRIYDKQYNKLLETRVADVRGRYAFLVDNNVYYVTAEKLGYQPFKTQDIDLVSQKREAVVGFDIGLDKAGVGVAQPVAPTELPSVVPAAKSSITPPTAPPPTETKPEITAVPPSVPITPPVAAAPRPTEKPTLVKRVEGPGVSRESLQELLTTKQAVSEIKEDIIEEKQHLEKLEEKVEKIEEKIGENQQDKQDKQDKSASAEALADKQDGSMPPPVSSKPDQDGTEKSIFG